MLPFIVLLLSLGPLLLLWNYLKSEAQDRKIGVSGPRSTLLLGNIPDLWKDIKNKTVFKKATEFCDEFGDTYRLRIGSKLVILTRDVKIIENIIHNPKFVKSDDYRFSRDWLGNGLIRSSGEHWHKFRKLITPAFHFQILERFVVVFEEQTDVLIQNLKKFCDDRVVDVVPIFHAFALDVISESAMGVKLNSQSNPDNKFLEATQEILHYLGMRFFSLLHSKDWFWRHSLSGKREKEKIAYIHNFVDKIIDSRRTELLAQKGDGLRESGKERPVLLDILLKSELDGKPLRNEDIRAEVNTFMFAGHETTGTTLGFLIYVLAKHPDVQQKVFQEICDLNLHEKTGPLTMRAANSLIYAENVIRETLRLYPILSGAHKKCTEDIRIGNLFIPANVSVVTLIYANHHNPKYFENPEKFDPDRWNKEISSEERNPLAYQPFSAGLRNCIGQKYAVLELKIVLIKLLREFKIELGYEGFTVDMAQSSLLYSRNGVQIKFRKRQIAGNDEI